MTPGDDSPELYTSGTGEQERQPAEMTDEEMTDRIRQVIARWNLSDGRAEPIEEL